MSYSKAIMTQKGLTLLAKAQGGAQLNFTRVAIGDGVTLSNWNLLTGLVNELKTLAIESITLENNMTRVRSSLTNVGVLVGFHIKEIGLFATDPDDGEILYAVISAGDGPADYIPEETSNAVEEVIEILTFINGVANINTIIDGSIVYASQEKLNTLQAQLNSKPNRYSGVSNFPIGSNLTINKAACTVNTIVQIYPQETTPEDKVGTWTVESIDGSFTLTSDPPEIVEIPFVWEFFGGGQ